jgi:ABC-type branched-subunit amino acid transport system substrate-binding protein
LEQDLTFSQVVPTPEGKDQLATEFREDMKKAGLEKEIGYIAFESYINARIISEALQRTGASPTRMGFIAALEGDAYKVGPLTIDFSPTLHSVTGKIYLTVAKGKKLVSIP